MVLTPIAYSELRNMLTRGAVQFAFKKLDGNLRTAFGTTNLSSIPSEYHPKGRREASSKVVVFFDLEKRQWRSLSKNVEVFVFLPS